MNRACSLFLILLILTCCTTRLTGRFRRESYTWYRVESVTTPDSVMLKGIGRVKYAGVTMPQISLLGGKKEPYSLEALQENRELTLGKWARLELDRVERDSSGTIRAYIFVKENGVECFVNGELVRRGCAKVAISTVNLKYHDILCKLEAESRNRHLGMWSYER